MTGSIPPASLFARALSSASKAFNQPTIQDSTQELVQSTLTDLRTLQSRIASLSLFSPNESLEDIATRDLIYLLVPYVCAEMQGRVRATERAERMVVLRQANEYLRTFLDSLDNYEIIPENERQLYERKASAITDPAKRRELKIKQYQYEKHLQARIEVIRKRRGQHPQNDIPSNFDLILYLLPSSSEGSSLITSDDDEDDSQTDDIVREATLLVLRLCYAQAQSQLESMDQELQLLRNAPPTPIFPTVPDDGDRKERGTDSDIDMWRLDAPHTHGVSGQGPLLDPSGKPLRPFTILPAGAADRTRLQAQVFGPGHRLPTMSIDEYLRIEGERGNIISGGGPASEAAPTSSEQLALEAEMDGTGEGEEKAEVKRIKDENWARFTDENPKGAGNTMNRG